MSSAILAQFPALRPRRLRQTPALRALVAETRLSAHQLVLPLFVRAGRKLPPYLGYAIESSLGNLFAAAINKGDKLGKEILQVLIDSAKGEREIGAMGRHVVRALLVANNPTGWEFIEKMLLAAQRQEGLRQSILEVIDEAHPIAYQRMLKLIIDENLIRFSATIRAVDVWFGFALDH